MRRSKADVLPGDVVDEERSRGSSVVAARYRPAEKRRDLKEGAWNSPAEPPSSTAIPVQNVCLK